MSDERRFVFLIPEVEASPIDAPPVDHELRRDALPIPTFLTRAREVPISPQQLSDFWNDNVVGLTSTLADAQANNDTKGFRVDEISFSIGVGAKGGIFFVAEGSIEANMSITLRRSE